MSNPIISEVKSIHFEEDKTGKVAIAIEVHENAKFRFLIDEMEFAKFIGTTMRKFLTMQKPNEEPHA